MCNVLSQPVETGCAPFVVYNSHIKIIGDGVTCQRVENQNEQKDC